MFRRGRVSDLRRALDGLPSGGRAGPLYGYAPGERKLSHGRQAGCKTWVIHDPQASWVRWLYETVAATDPCDLSLRKLTADLERRGAPTATGVGHWDTTHVRSLLRNPKYCGRGRNGRYTSTWIRERDPLTGHVREVKRVTDRLHDPQGWDEQTLPLAHDAIPPIITPDLFDRVQAILRAAAALHNRGGPRRADPAARATLLDGGYVFCAACGNKMTRFWQRRDKHPYYQCNKVAGVPYHEHPRQAIAAATVDTLVLQTLAHALTDPEHLMQIADAAEQERRAAEADLELAEAQDAATTTRLTALAAEQEHVETAIAALASVTGVGAEITRLRTRLTALTAEQQELLSVRHEVAITHAAARAVIVRSLFTTRDLLFRPDGGMEEVGDAYLSIGSRMTTRHAAAFLGLPSTDALTLPVRTGHPFLYQTTEGWEREREADTVLTADVLYACLRNLSRDHLRAILRTHQVTVRVTPPRPRVLWAERGPTRAEDRVEVVLHGSLVLRPASSQVCHDEGNMTLMSKMS
ncbi:MAG TPA: recombinase family protein [Ktedonobacterales bacterium]